MSFAIKNRSEQFQDIIKDFPVSKDSFPHNCGKIFWKIRADSTAPGISFPVDSLTRAVFSIHEYPYVLIPDTINLQKIKSRYSILQSSDPAEKGIVFYAELMGRLIEFFAETETKIVGVAKAALHGNFR